MIESLLKATLGISVVTLGLLIVQTMLARTNKTPTGKDPLAGRLGCHGCGCGNVCEKHK